MTAVTHPEKAWYSDPKGQPRCVFCRSKAEVPYIEWSGALWCSSSSSRTIIICARCCRWSDGLVADLKTVKSTVIARYESTHVAWVSEVRQ
jgi:hypothetical protein